MADPISLLAIAGLVFAGRKMSDPVVTAEAPAVAQVPKPPLLEDAEIVVSDEPYFVEASEPDGGKREMASFAEIAPQQRSDGTEVLNMRNRLYDNGRMNNLSPVEKQLVGPGLGVAADVPAVGGYQQMFRVAPVNTGEYRLTHLPGRVNHGFDVKGGRRTMETVVQHNRPEKTAQLDQRLPPVAGRSVHTGVTPRNKQERTKRPTNRSQTGLRTDGLSNAPPKRFISAQAIPQEPTRFKMDNDTVRFGNAQPGLTEFRGGYQQSPAAQVGKSDAELMALGFRIDDKRGVETNRMANRGRMNVCQQSGKLTTFRCDTSRMDGRFNAANGGWQQNYRQNDYHKFNAFKGHENPYASPEHLNSTKEQLKNNPYAQCW